jgi:hypothetical protein
LGCMCRFRGMRRGAALPTRLVHRPTLLCTCLRDPGLSKFIDEMEFDLTFLVQLYDYISDVPIKVPTQKLTCVRSITAGCHTY